MNIYTADIATLSNDEVLLYADEYLARAINMTKYSTFIGTPTGYVYATILRPSLKAYQTMVINLTKSFGDSEKERQILATQNAILLNFYNAQAALQEASKAVQEMLISKELTNETL